MNEQEPPEGTDERVDWRMDADKSHSDWTIEIAALDDKGTATATTKYHVHRCILTFGSRKSEYFVAMCRSDSEFAENETRNSPIELPSIAASAFPAMLDFIYANDASFPIDTNNASVLHKLGEYFGMPQLVRTAKKFIDSDLGMHNFQIYLYMTLSIDDTITLNHVKSFCVKHLGRL